jgi:hypothetical protein
MLECERGKAMNSGNSLQEKIPLSVGSLITTLIKFRNLDGSFLNAIPKDVTNYIIGIIKQLPIHNIFDVLTAELSAICHYYKLDTYIFKNCNHDLACEVEEVIKLLKINKKADPIHSFIHLMDFIQALTAVLKNKSGRLYNKIAEFNDKYDLVVVTHQSPWYLEDAHKMHEHVALSNVITALSAYTKESRSAIIAYLAEKSFCEANRKKLLANLDKRYKDIVDFSSYEAMNLAVIEREVNHHLIQECIPSSPRELSKF